VSPNDMDGGWGCGGKGIACRVASPDDLVDAY